MGTTATAYMTIVYPNSIIKQSVVYRVLLESTWYLRDLAVILLILYQVKFTVDTSVSTGGGDASVHQCGLLVLSESWWIVTHHTAQVRGWT
ncbi:hypothetical protein KY289_007058 [Solanum tuberosum]|nr:hypothetical protein KY289_007058 [Solanum tuberosum]